MSLGLIPPMPVAKIFEKSPERICVLETGGVGTSFCIGTPSMTHSGSALPVMVLVPRMRIFTASPGRPDTDCTLTPASLPCNSLSTPSKGEVLRSFPSITATEPVLLRISVLAKPVTTTCPMSVACSFKVTSYTKRSPKRSPYSTLTV